MSIKGFGIFVLGGIITIVALSVWAYRTFWVEGSIAMRGVYGGGMIAEQSRLMLHNDFKFLDGMPADKLVLLGFAPDNWLVDGQLLGPGGTKVTYHSVKNGASYRIDFEETKDWLCRDTFPPGLNLSSKVQINNQDVTRDRDPRALCIDGDNTISLIGP